MGVCTAAFSRVCEDLGAVRRAYYYGLLLTYYSYDSKMLEQSLYKRSH